jgi:replicative DNA helicase
MTDPFTPAQLPWSPDAEREIIAAAFVDPRILDEIAEILSPDDWYHAVHRKFYEALLTVWRRGDMSTDGGAALNPIRLWDELERNHGLDRGEALKWFAGLSGLAGTSAHALGHAQEVRRLALLRRLAETCQDIATEACELPDDVEVFAGQAEQRIREIAAGSRTGELRTIDQGVQTAADHIHAASQGDGRVRGLPTGFRDLDDLIGGLPFGATWLAGRSKHGKSSLALQIATRVAARGHGVFIWSGEMREVPTAGRMFGRMARVDVKMMLECPEKLSAEEGQRIVDAQHRLRELPILCDYQTGLTAQQVCLRAQRARRELGKRGFPLRLVVLDHFHRMEHGESDFRRRQDQHMRRSSNQLTDWSKNEEQATLILAQVNRSGGGRRPMARDIRECGAAEEDCELTIGVYWPWKDDSSKPFDVSEALVLEQRLGATGVATLGFNAPQMRFYDR